MKAEIRERFNNPVQYDAGMNRTFAGYDVLHTTVLSFLSANVGDTANVLDAGCGTGTTLVAFGTHQPNWTLTGVDPVEAMLNQARAKLDERGLGSRVHLQVGSVDVLPPAPAFDAASLVLVEHLLPDDGTKQALLNGIAQRIKPGGWFIMVSMYGDFSTAETQQALAAWQMYMKFQELPDQVRAGSVRRATVEDSLVPAARIEAMLSQAGFANATLVHKVHLVGAWLAQKI